LVNNKLLADDFARAGYFTVIPDIFEEEPVPSEYLLNPGSIQFDLMAWKGRHPAERVDPIIESTIKGMKELGVKNIGSVGYCFGAKYVVRFLAEGKGVDAGFIAHPVGLQYNTLSTSIHYTFDVHVNKAPFSAVGMVV
jgi:dienelactone hydrolase